MCVLAALAVRQAHLLLNGKRGATVPLIHRVPCHGVQCPSRKKVGWPGPVGCERCWGRVSLCVPGWGWVAGWRRWLSAGDETRVGLQHTEKALHCAGEQQGFTVPCRASRTHSTPCINHCNNVQFTCCHCCEAATALCSIFGRLLCLAIASNVCCCCPLDHGFTDQLTQSAFAGQAAQSRDAWQVLG
jgi:hypothetical protein